MGEFDDGALAPDSAEGEKAAATAAAAAASSSGGGSR